MGADGLHARHFYFGLQAKSGLQPSKRNLHSHGLQATWLVLEVDAEWLGSHGLPSLGRDGGRAPLVTGGVRLFCACLGRRGCRVDRVGLLVFTFWD